MEELKKLEELSLVSKVCTELENHLGISDKDLGTHINFFDCPTLMIQTNFHFTAEFVIALAKENTTFQSFKKALASNGADFSVSFSFRYWR
jgi:ATP-dependent RNA helicase DHX8/PRP22